MATAKPFDTSAVNHLVMIGWAGRDAAAVEAHIRELEHLGLTRPSRTPVFYRVASSLLTTSKVIEVVGGRTSGEVEFVLVQALDGLWVGLGSDHTDRDIETSSVAHSKQLCAKVVAKTLWRYDEIAPHWDQLVLRAWAHRAGRRELYQEGTAAAILPPTTLIAGYEATTSAIGTGVALFSGTLSTVSGIAPADAFEMELIDPVFGRTLHHEYHIVELPIVS